jgi:hypothetical protein
MSTKMLFTLKLTSDYDAKRKKDFEAEIDMLEYNPETMHILRVRVINIWKRPTWMSSAWFAEIEKVQS